MKRNRNLWSDTVLGACVGGALIGLIVLILQVATIEASDGATPWQQPYGGCDEAWQAPHSDGADECRAHGWIITATGAHLPLKPVRVLRPCPSDEGESPYPCAWYAPAMGNGKGHSFRIYRDGRVKQISHRRAFQLLGECSGDGPLVCR